MAVDLTDPVFSSALLEGCKSAINEIVEGRSDRASQRALLKQLLDRLGYRAAPDRTGTMDDLRSDLRLNLVLRTNVSLAWCYRQYQESMHPDILEAEPAQELFRIGRRKICRPWSDIWVNARAGLAETTASKPEESGRMFALKVDPIWATISDFGLPWPPFKFGSGMGVMGIDWNGCLDLGLVDESKGTLEEAIKAALTRPEPGQVPLIVPDFDAILIRTWGEIDSASFPPSWD